MARPSAAAVTAAVKALPSTSPEPVPKRNKRKQDEIPEDEKLEIDVSLPEPPSKKAKRLEKKSVKKGSTKKKQDAPSFRSEIAEGIVAKRASRAKIEAEGSAVEVVNADATTTAPTTGVNAPTNGERSAYAIWIGNLPFSATKKSLREFFAEHGKILDQEITRVHMPAPTTHSQNSREKTKGTNKGFAYVDFSTPEAHRKAMGLSEWMMGGRRVLIKDAKSFEGRPKPEADVDGKVKGNKTWGGGEVKRVFVGNLGFDVTTEDLQEHFGVAGEVEDIHMATFQDSGKCKGFAWIRFVEPSGAEAAVRGFVYVKADDDGGEDSAEDESSSEEDNAADTVTKKSKKKAGARRHKKHINQLHGRPLRVEFAEDAQTRYKKRYGSDRPKDPSSSANKIALPADRRANTSVYDDPAAALAVDGTDKLGKGRKQRTDVPYTRPGADERRDVRRKKHEDARNVAPGKALAGAQRATGAIVEAKGTKVTFE